MVHGSVHGFVHGLVYDLVHGVLHNVLLEHGGLPCIFPLNVHLDLDFGHHCDTQWYLRLLSEHLITLRPFKSVLDYILHQHG